MILQERLGCVRCCILLAEGSLCSIWMDETYKSRSMSAGSTFGAKLKAFIKN
jgi:hypothetical protein